MNKKERARRFWKVNFVTQWRKRIVETVEFQFGVDATKLCLYIAEMAERLSEGRFTTVHGILLVNDKRPNQVDPIGMPHAWNVMDRQIVDLSPWPDCGHKLEYIPPDHKDYEFWRQQTFAFGDVEGAGLAHDVDQLMFVLLNPQIEFFNVGVQG